MLVTKSRNVPDRGAKSEAPCLHASTVVISFTMLVTIMTGFDTRDCMGSHNKANAEGRHSYSGRYSPEPLKEAP